MQTEIFDAGSDDQNRARDEGFRRMVEAGGQEWPDGWVKGEGFVRRHATDDPMRPPPTVAEAGEEYVRHVIEVVIERRVRMVQRVKVTVQPKGALTRRLSPTWRRCTAPSQTHARSAEKGVASQPVTTPTTRLMTVASTATPNT
ncbi:MAG: hypothetical protein QOK15_3920 [Nocardioidaceae bacterium]|nr:hypothetical protein [Nocardioidaceae bacterium]